MPVVETVFMRGTYTQLRQMSKYIYANLCTWRRSGTTIKEDLNQRRIRRCASCLLCKTAATNKSDWVNTPRHVLRLPWLNNISLKPELA